VSALAGLAIAARVHADDTNRFQENLSAMMMAAVADTADPAAQLAAVPTNGSPWQSTLSFGATLTSGNSDTLLADAALNTHRTNPTNEWLFGAEAAYGKNNSVENTETLHGFGQYDHLFTPRWFGYARADALHDGIADVKYRVTLSPGVGYYFVKNKATSLAGEAGPGAVFERLDGHEDLYSTPRAAGRFEHKWDEHTRLWGNVEYLPQINDPVNFLVNAEVGLEAALTKRLSLRTVLQDYYANIPAPGRKDNDLRLVSGLAFKF